MLIAPVSDASVVSGVKWTAVAVLAVHFWKLAIGAFAVRKGEVADSEGSSRRLWLPTNSTLLESYRRQLEGGNRQAVWARRAGRSIILGAVTFMAIVAASRL